MSNPATPTIQFFDLSVTDKHIHELKANIPEIYHPDFKRWKCDQDKKFYYGMIAGLNIALSIFSSATMNREDKLDYIKKISVDAALISESKKIILR